MARKTIADLEGEERQAEIELRLKTASVQEILEIVSEVARNGHSNMGLDELSPHWVDLNPQWVDAQMKLALERLRFFVAETLCEPFAETLVENKNPDESSDRYFVRLAEKEVAKEDYIKVERNAGFHSKSGPDEIATASFQGGNGDSGRVEYVKRG